MSTQVPTNVFLCLISIVHTYAIQSPRQLHESQEEIATSLTTCFGDTGTSSGTYDLRKLLQYSLALYGA
jgi:hypothetical protein